MFFSGEKYNKRVTSFYCLIIRVLYGLWGVGRCNCCFSLIMNVAVLLCSRTSSCPKATISIFTTAASQETSRASKVISRKFQLGGKKSPLCFPSLFLLWMHCCGRGDRSSLAHFHISAEPLAQSAEQSHIGYRLISVSQRDK